MKINNIHELEQISIHQLPSVPLELRRTLPNCTAIYLLLAFNNIPIYIGQAGKKYGGLVLRWQNHQNLIKNAPATIYPNLKIAWIECSNDSILDIVEYSLIQHFKPMFNKIGNKEVFNEKDNDYIKQLRFLDIELDIFKCFLQHIDANNVVNLIEPEITKLISINAKDVHQGIKRLLNKNKISKFQKRGNYWIYKLNSSDEWID